MAIPHVLTNWPPLGFETQNSPCPGAIPFHLLPTLRPVDVNDEFVIVNCDGSFRPLDRSFGYGVIIRDQYGKFIRAKANYEKTEELHGPIVLLIEMTAIRDGLQLAKEMRYPRVKVLSDSKNAVEIIMDLKACPMKCSDILREILVLKRYFNDSSFEFVYREYNRAADFLSRFKRSRGKEYFNYASQLPPDLKEIIIEDIKCGIKIWS